MNGIHLPQCPITLHNVEFPSPEEKAGKFVALYASGKRIIIIILKRICRVSIYLTRWEHRALYNNTNNTHTRTHAHTHTRTRTHAHTHA